MNNTSYLWAVFALVLAGCSSMDESCEEVTLSSEQVQQCQQLQRQIVQAKGRPILRTELERRYEKDCIEIRYYRDDKQPAICGNKEKIEQIKKAIKEEQKQ